MRLSSHNVVTMAVPRRRFRIGPDNGTLLLRTRRAGLASRVGHDLTLELTAWSAEIELPDPSEPASGGVEATVDLSTLEVREGSAGAVPLTDRDRREIENNARRLLAVDRFPTATFAADRITGSETEAMIGGTLALNGTWAPIVLQVRQVSPNRWHAVTTVAQTALGIKPYSAFLGALKLRDDVVVECQVDLTQPEGTAAV